MADLKKQLADLKGRVLQGALVSGTSMQTRVPDSVDPCMTAQWRRDFDLLRRYMSDHEAEVEVKMRQIEMLVGEKLVEMRAEMARARTTHVPDAGLRSEVNVLRKEVKLLKARMSAKKDVLGGRAFSSLPDVLLFVTRYVPPNMYYLFHDVMTLLESINDAFTTRKEVLLELSQSQKVGFNGQA